MIFNRNSFAADQNRTVTVKTRSKLVPYLCDHSLPNNWTTETTALGVLHRILIHSKRTGMYHCTQPLSLQCGCGSGFLHEKILHP